MKILLLAAGATLIALPHTAAKAGSIVIGNPAAAECYEAALERDDSPTGMRLCNDALEESLSTSDRVATYVNRGILHMLRGSRAMAEADFNQAIALDNSAADPLLNKGILLTREGKGKEALPLIEAAMARKARREALAFYARGIAYEQMGNVRAAYADLVKARDLEPGWDLPAQELTRYQVRRR